MMNLRTIGRYLDEGIKLTLVQQLVISKLDYCNSLYMNLPKTRLNKLRSTLNGAVRFIYNIEDRTTDLVPFYKKAHILPIDQRIFFKVCLCKKLEKYVKLVIFPASIIKIKPNYFYFVFQIMIKFLTENVINYIASSILNYHFSYIPAFE